LLKSHTGTQHATLHAKFAEFAGSDLGFDSRLYVSESSADHSNRSIADLLVGTGAVESEPDSVCDAYTLSVRRKLRPASWRRWLRRL
jgi:glutaminase